MLSFLLLVTLAELKETITLETGGRFLSTGNYEDVTLEKDASFIVRTRYHIWHFNADGSVRARFGGKGEAPGEFQNIGSVQWDGSHYWVIDSQRLTSSIHDQQGNFLFSKPIWYRQFISAGDDLFVIDLSRYKRTKESRPPMLYQIEYEITPDDLIIKEPGLHFKKVTERQANFKLNFKLAWLVPDDKDGYLAMDQLHQRIWRFSPVTIKRENQVDDNEGFEPPYIQLQLKEWVEPPERFISMRQSSKTIADWWFSWSRVTSFSRYKDGFMVGYEIDDPNDSGSLQMLQRLDTSGKRIGEPLKINGFLAGVRGDDLFIFMESDDGTMEYYIEVYEL